ncbi:hypothetical protein SAMN05421770_10458 [Granulicella rosea]|uniref:Uncharacterized protein n=1 Tax=Granulicella rosea TaxID=474952 RepID=A0A239JQD9_9BACT|nr:hypothetical protein [Granulicella rosea]SNT07638.1 hypothetical protein SAMN05421770_10458 [Granulicella rosea]
MEHDWYDLQDQLPRNIKRRFSRLAGLLDLADSEFLDMRKKKLEYERSVSVRLEAQVPDMSDVAIDQVSLKSFTAQDVLVKELDAKIAKIRNLELQSEKTPESFRPQVELVLAAGLRTLEELRNSLAVHRDAIIEYVELCKSIWDRRGKPANILPGVSVLYLVVILLAKKGDQAALAVFKKARLVVHDGFDEQLENARKALGNIKSE